MKDAAGNREEDRDLVQGYLRRGDEDTFRRLYRRHTPVLYLMALRLMGGAGRGAEDAVQEAWIRALRGLTSFRWEASLRTWLTGITIRVCQESLRRQAGRSEPLPPEAGWGAPSDEGKAARIDLERAVRTLPDGAREVLVLHDIEGLTHEEIGDRLGIQDGTSKSQLHKARKALRALLRGEGPAGRSEAS
ncbi:MAG: RNA polymerase sigma factor [Candidatus Polarisedimenticolia bacterium]